MAIEKCSQPDEIGLGTCDRDSTWSIVFLGVGSQRREECYRCDLHAMTTTIGLFHSKVFKLLTLVRLGAWHG